jgi:hypothetical protein
MFSNIQNFIESPGINRIGSLAQKFTTVNASVHLVRATSSKPQATSNKRVRLKPQATKTQAAGNKPQAPWRKAQASSHKRQAPGYPSPYKVLQG